MQAALYHSAMLRKHARNKTSGLKAPLPMPVHKNNQVKGQLPSSRPKPHAIHSSTQRKPVLNEASLLHPIRSVFHKSPSIGHLSLMRSKSTTD
ncbi:hypothetical protein BDV27DRAFT_65817 [Aspergillus caelatus]|uniref:Uncharacterized protein n=1 Tax=Aspergillus caelatus TaxID=61420 RepID=A0A5N6ZM17_9EURO|nr:uncharacterized protein BDV27DRAFT_65817 [Aspergillus caelatus]KAE8358644.1 hypothetical protein BDV27DRAFT_65817 [Aspergillus caelatus]